jgi:hypothetical protein
MTAVRYRGESVPGQTPGPTFGVQGQPARPYGGTGFAWGWSSIYFWQGTFDDGFVTVS